MANDKKTITKKLRKVIDDLMDNYEKYNDEDKLKVKKQMKDLIDLNKSLDKYDSRFTNIWDLISDAFNKFFGKK